MVAFPVLAGGIRSDGTCHGLTKLMVYRRLSKQYKYQGEGLLWSPFAHACGLAQTFSCIQLYRFDTNLTFIFLFLAT